MSDRPADVVVAGGAGKTEEDPRYWEIVWGQFCKRKIARASLYGILGLFFIATYAPLVISNKPFVWRVDNGELEWPWFATLFDRTFFENGIDIFFNSLMFPGTLCGIGAWVVFRRTKALPRRRRQARRKRALALAGGLWLFVLLAILQADYAAPKVVYPQEEASLRAMGHEVTAWYPLHPFSSRDGEVSSSRHHASARHPLGTDNAGRDVLARLVYGTRISLTVGLLAVLLYVSFGTALGAVAGYNGGRVDAYILRAVEVVICIPSLFLILTVASFIEERSIFHIMFLIAAVGWTTPARLVRAEFLRLRDLDFVKAARAMGYKPARIIFREILPNAIGPVLVTATFGVASAILVESTMSFLGLGDPSLPSWGQILNTGRTTRIWTLILAPGAAIFLTVSLLNLFGEGLRDALDPKLRR